jgi:hypothetical protein
MDEFESLSHTRWECKIDLHDHNTWDHGLRSIRGRGEIERHRTRARHGMKLGRDQILELVLEGEQAPGDARTYGSVSGSSTLA